jgi:CheY-like chemotaxis protein
MTAMTRDNESTGRQVVLLVEDELILREMAADALAERGFAVVAVASGEEALQHLMAGHLADALFTDIHLAGDMDGATLVTLARQLRPDLPVVYTSGNALPEQIKPVSGSIFVPKPYNPNAIARMLKSLIDAARPVAARRAYAG